MSWLKQFKSPELAQKIVSSIENNLKILNSDKPVQIMEVCGGHTHTLFRYGIHQLFGNKIEFVHGPGCPVCVLPVEVIDDCFELTQNKNIILTTFGDAMRVPGKHGSLLTAKAKGADIRMVYSPLDALDIAKANPEKEVVFLGLGFDTTMPSTAMSVVMAKKMKIQNFSLYPVHITIIPTLKALLESGDVIVDGFIGPGHVSMVIGTDPYEFIPKDYHLPFVVSGFEPIDILHSIDLLITQLITKQAKVENQYCRTVLSHGNEKALSTIHKVFKAGSGFNWRGLGEVKESGVEMQPAYQAFDAIQRFSIGVNNQNKQFYDELGLCAHVITGAKKPTECPLFDNGCSPKTPVGALMVSNEGACAAYYQYARKQVSHG